MTPPSSPRPTTQPHIRIARPTNDLPSAERFYASGLGLDVLWRSQSADLMAVGWPAAAWHLELVHDPQVMPRPTVEDLLVLYLGRQPDDELIARLKAHGGTQVTAHNPYWDTNGVTIQDPDGYRLVLSHRTWNPTR